MIRGSTGPGVSREGREDAGTEMSYSLRLEGKIPPTYLPNTSSGSDSLLHTVLDGNCHVTEGKRGEVAHGVDRTFQVPYL